jgi:hypothetical protein
MVGSFLSGVGPSNQYFPHRQCGAIHKEIGPRQGIAMVPDGDFPFVLHQGLNCERKPIGFWLTHPRRLLLESC